MKAHQHSAGAAGKENQAIGKSAAGNISKINMVVDVYGLPIAFKITGEEVHGRKTSNIKLCNCR